MLDDPVTLAITRVPRPGCELEWEEVVGEIHRTTRGFPGSLGATVLKPSPGGRRVYRIIVRFDSLVNFQRWESSPDRQRLLKHLQSLESEPVKIEQATGLETWFEASGDMDMKPPQRYKLMIASGIGVYLTITPLLFALGPVLNRLPLYISTLLVVPVMVPLLTYVTMPLITRALKPWLYGGK